MPKKVKKRKVATSKKHFKAPWWKLFFVVAAAALIALPTANKLNIAPFDYDILGEKTASESSNLSATGKKVVGRLVVVNSTEIAGWACDRSAPDSELTVEFAVAYPGSRSAAIEKTVLGQAVANLPIASNNVGIAAEKACKGMTLGNNHRFSFTPTGLEASKIALIHAYVVKNGEKIRLIESPRVLRPLKTTITGTTSATGVTQ